MATGNNSPQRRVRPGGVVALAVGLIVGLAVASSLRIPDEPAVTTPGAAPAAPDRPNHPLQARERPSGPVELTGLSILPSYIGILRVAFTIRNDNPFPVKDAPVSCALIAPSGTIIGVRDADVYQIIPAHGAIEVRDLDLGFKPQQLAKISCGATHGERAD